MKYVIFGLIIVSLFIVGCSQTDPLEGYCNDDEMPVVICQAIDKEPIVDVIVGDPNKSITLDDKVIIDSNLSLEDIIVDEINEKIEPDLIINVEEGELVSLANLEVKDPDGDVIELFFEEPLDVNGEWQTTSGDKGEYLVMVTASDGIDETSIYVLINVSKGNQPPVIKVKKEITVLEGEEVFIDVETDDPDGDDVTVTFSGWMSNSIYKTNYDDAGEHKVIVSATDGIYEVYEEVKVTVIDVNRAPVIEKPNYDVIALEGELIELEVNAYDPDGDEFTLSFSEPFNDEGKWQTEEGDYGKYEVIITASDGKDSYSIELPVEVKSTNNPPDLEFIEDIEVDEGETVYIEVEAYDPDGDELTIIFSGWMEEDTYTTNYEDSGTYIVTVTVSDGKESVSQDVTITVNDVNRPPRFILN